MTNSSKYSSHPALRIILNRLRREEIQQCWLLGILGVGALAGFIFIAHLRPIIGALCFGLMLVCGRFCFIKMNQIGKTEEKLLNILYHRPLDVVWVYTMIYQQMPFGFQMNRKGILYIKLFDRDEITISLPEKHLRLTSKFLSRMLPEATIGYSEERAQWYNAHPEMLRQSKE